jgi:DNA-binding XRE family transcriptional regulator
MATRAALQRDTAKHHSDRAKPKRRRPKRRRAAVFLRPWRAVRRLPGLLSGGRLSGQALKTAGKVRRGGWRPAAELWIDGDRWPGLPEGATFYFRGCDGGGSRRHVRVRIMTYKRSELKTVFGKAFRAARLAAGLSQEKVRELTGVAQSEISKIERLDPRANPTLETMGRLARAVNRPLHELLKPE